MMLRNLDASTLGKIQELIEANFTGRDELYAAAASVTDESRERICHRLAEHLAANAVELQQVVAASGFEPAGPLDTEAIAHVLFDLARLNQGDSGVLNAAAEGERNLKQDYNHAIEVTADQEATSILRRQREEVEFAEDVLRNIESSSVDGKLG